MKKEQFEKAMAYSQKISDSLLDMLRNPENENFIDFGADEFDPTAYFYALGHAGAYLFAKMTQEEIDLLDYHFKQIRLTNQFDQSK